MKRERIRHPLSALLLIDGLNLSSTVEGFLQFDIQMGRLAETEAITRLFDFVLSLLFGRNQFDT